MTQFPAGLPTGMPSLPTPDARYILPQFEERTPYGFKRQDRPVRGDHPRGQRA